MQNSIILKVVVVDLWDFGELGSIITPGELPNEVVNRYRESGPG